MTQGEQNPTPETLQTTPDAADKPLPDEQPAAAEASDLAAQLADAQAKLAEMQDAFLRAKAKPEAVTPADFADHVDYAVRRIGLAHVGTPLTSTRFPAR